MKPNGKFKNIAIGIGFILMYFAVQIVVARDFSSAFVLYSIVKSLANLFRLANGELDYNAATDVLEGTNDDLINQTFFISFLSNLVMLAILLFWAAARKRKPLPEVGLVKMEKCWWPICFVMGLAANVVVSVLINVIPLPESLIDAYSQGFTFTSSNDYGVFFAAVVLFAPLTEEVVFRGLAYGRFKQSASIFISSALCSLIFGVCHGSVLQAAYTIPLGFLLCLVFERCRSLWAAVMVHVGFNFGGFIFELVSIDSSITVECLMLIAGLAADAAMLIYLFTKTEKPQAVDFISGTAQGCVSETENKKYVR